jgi:hypothetical protein
MRSGDAGLIQPDGVAFTNVVRLGVSIHWPPAAKPARPVSGNAVIQDETYFLDPL